MSGGLGETATLDPLLHQSAKAAAAGTHPELRYCSGACSSGREQQSAAAFHLVPDTSAWQTKTPLAQVESRLLRSVCRLAMPAEPAAYLV